ncbi:MAG: BamA/TamA family outer membrane protein [Bacteroidota bacterium]|nr:BamA/TamA family outer membrane protein [Bacteroidota bacterium]
MRRIILLLFFLPVALPGQDSDTAFDHLPFAMYDTDTGFGAGYKGVLRNALGSRESFDLTLFLSTKGERWVRICASWPDAELRQGSAYPLAFDVVMDYDKMITNSFFGVGPDARYDDREHYTFEPLELTAAASRGFTPQIIGQLLLRFKRIWSYGFEDGSRLRTLETNASSADITSATLQLRYDTRNSVINPSGGVVLQGEIEQTIALTEHGHDWTRGAAWGQYYHGFGSCVGALRLGLHSMLGDDIPVQHMLPIGGNGTVRGIPKDRFLDRSSVVFNTELRFPIYRRLGGIVALDAGSVAPKLADLPASRWILTPVAGLRLIFDTFVTRADIGWSEDAVGFYLNFGQLF